MSRQDVAQEFVQWARGDLMMALHAMAGCIELARARVECDRSMEGVPPSVIRQLRHDLRMTNDTKETAMAHEEYLRRNLVHASSLGALANTRAALARARANRSTPKWLIEALEGIEERAAKVPQDMAAWRNAAPDAPVYTKER